MKIKKAQALELLHVLNTLTLNKVTDIKTKLSVVRILGEVRKVSGDFDRFRDDVQHKCNDGSDSWQTEAVKLLNAEAMTDVDLHVETISEDAYAQIIESNPDLTVGQMASMRVLVG